MMIMTSKTSGFTLVELMIVVAIIGVLSTIAIPKFAMLLSKSQEATTKGNLGTLRTALSIYYADTDGRFPTTATMLAGKYLKNIPAAAFPKTINNFGHPPLNSVTTVPSTGGLTFSNYVQMLVLDDGGWIYDRGDLDTNWGSILADCSASDLRGVPWNNY